MQVVLSEIVTPYGVMILVKCGELFAIGATQEEAEKQIERVMGESIKKRMWY